MYEVCTSVQRSFDQTLDKICSSSEREKKKFFINFKMTNKHIDIRKKINWTMFSKVINVFVKFLKSLEHQVLLLNLARNLRNMLLMIHFSFFCADTSNGYKYIAISDTF